LGNPRQIIWLKGLAIDEYMVAEASKNLREANKKVSAPPPLPPKEIVLGFALKG